LKELREVAVLSYNLANSSLEETTTGWLAGWLAGCLTDWLADWLAGWLAGWLAD